jgi:hypothetical protein
LIKSVEVAPTIPPNSMDIEVNFGAGDFSSHVILSKGTSSIALVDPTLSNVSFIGFTRSSEESCSSQTYVLDSSSIKDTSYNNNNPSLHGNNDGLLLMHSRLKSELELKTESLKERLNEIKILQTQLQQVTAVLQGKESELAGAKAENQRLTLEEEQPVENLQEELESIQSQVRKQREQFRSQWNCQEDDQELSRPSVLDVDSQVR